MREAIRAVALELGFVRVGFATAGADPEAAAALERWRTAGHAGELDYLLDPKRRDDPRDVFPDARTVLSVAMPHSSAPLQPTERSGLIARYAVGADYHDVLRTRLSQLAARIATLVGRPVRSRRCVDSAPLLEHALAARAGLGFVGRHTLTIVPGAGSYVLLGELLLELELPPDPPLAPRCGTCTRCLDACPTGAFVRPFTLDARRCISYLTIELRGSIPRELRPAIGAWVFGCDVCQEVCPYNAGRARRVPVPPALHPRPALRTPDLVELLHLGSKAHRRLVRGTVLHRVSRPRLSRNAAVVLGNVGGLDVVPHLVRALEHNSSALVRAHAAWALGQVLQRAQRGLRRGAPAAAEPETAPELGSLALARATAEDPDAEVRDEARAALDELAMSSPG